MAKRPEEPKLPLDLASLLARIEDPGLRRDVLEARAYFADRRTQRALWAAKQTARKTLARTTAQTIQEQWHLSDDEFRCLSFTPAGVLILKTVESAVISYDHECWHIVTTINIGLPRLTTHYYAVRRATTPRRPGDTRLPWIVEEEPGPLV